MSWFAVTRVAGPGWAEGTSLFEQPGAREHAAFVNGLADQGVVVFGGPLGGTGDGGLRVLLIVDAESEADVHRRLAADPWVPSEQLVTASVESWTIFVGAERLPTARVAAP